MFGIPVDELALIFDDNQSVRTNSSKPESRLQKKRQNVSYHFIQEGCAMDQWRIAYINRSLNVADLMTDLLPWEKRWRFVRMVLHHL